MKKNDPAIERIRGIRHQISAEFGHDPEKVLAYYMNVESEILRDGHARFSEEQSAMRPRSDA